MQVKEKISKTLWYIRIPLFVLFIAALAWGALLFYEWNHADDVQRELVKLHNQEVQNSESGIDRVLAERGESLFYDLNDDYKAWLTVYGSTVNHPVVQGENNEYYQKHDFYGLRSSFGTLHIDSGVDLEQEGANILIHGHNLRNGSMLGGLTKFESLNFFTEHDIITLEFPGDEWYYETFALLYIGNEGEAEYFPIENYINDIDEAETEELLTQLQERAVYWRDLTMNGTDEFLFLLTSDQTQGKGRLLLCARRLAT